MKIMRPEQATIWQGLRAIGYKGNLRPFGFTIDETIEAIEEEQEEDKYIEELEEEWRKKQLTPNEREQVFRDSGVSEEEIFEMKRKGILSRAEAFLRKYYKAKLDGEIVKNMEDKKRSFGIIYDILTGRRKYEITDDMVRQANEKELTPVLQLLGLKVNKSYTPCPWHEDKTPSLHITKNLFHCFSCGESGDTIKFIQKYLNFSFKETIKYLQ